LGKGFLLVIIFHGNILSLASWCIFLREDLRSNICWL